jgi:drug/metabolite transporter (DMT)-like permease
MCWGIIWYPYRIMQEAGVSGVASSFYTYLIAAILGTILFVRNWRGLFKHPKTIFLLAIVAGWTNLSYVLAIIDGEVMRVMLLFYLSPLWTLILAHFWLKEPINTRGVVTIAISLLGAFIMLSGIFNVGVFDGANILPLPENKAEWLALSSGMGFALTNVITRKSSHLSLVTKSMTVWFGVLLVALLFIPFQTLAFPAPSVFSALNWMVMVLIALILMAATLVVQYGVTQMPAMRASVIFLFELVVAAIASYYLANEKMQAHEWVGGGLIIAAALFAAWAEESRTDEN